MLATESALGTGAFNGVRIAVFDESPLFRVGIVHVLNAEPGMDVVAEGGSVTEAFCFNRKLSPDIVILDSNLFTADPTIGRSIVGRWPSARILVLAAGFDEEQVLAAFAAGARGYILKGVSSLELLEAVRALHRGEGYVSPALAAILLTHASLGWHGKAGNTSPLTQLTYRENEIFSLLAAGLKNREIGRRLDVTEKTVKRYVTRIFEKLHVRNRVEAALLSKLAAKPQIAVRKPQSVSVLAPLVFSPPVTGPVSKDGSSAEAQPVTGSVDVTNGGAASRRSGAVRRD